MSECPGPALPSGYEVIGGSIVPVETIHTFPLGEIIVSMIEYRGRVLVATSLNIYEIEDGKLRRLVFQPAPAEKPE